MKHIISGNMSPYDGFIRVLTLRRFPADIIRRHLRDIRTAPADGCGFRCWDGC